MTVPLITQNLLGLLLSLAHYAQETPSQMELTALLVTQLVQMGVKGQILHNAMIVPLATLNLLGLLLSLALFVVETLTRTELTVVIVALNVLKDAQPLGTHYVMTVPLTTLNLLGLLPLHVRYAQETPTRTELTALLVIKDVMVVKED